jgi:hypothetical protein
MAACKRRKTAGGIPSLLLVMVCLAAAYGCGARVPVEVVDLSGKIAMEMEKLRVSYINLVKTHYEFLRHKVDFYLKSTYVPETTTNSIKRLGSIGEGESLDTDITVKANRVEELSRKLFWRLEEKRKELMAPIDEQEQKALQKANEFFRQLARGNQTINDYLKGLRKLKEAQKEFIKTFKLDQLLIKTKKKEAQPIPGGTNEQ